MAASVAVLGFRPHTYWTAVVALGGTPKAPRVVERRRITFAAGHERSIYHQAVEAGLDQAEAMIEAARAATVGNAAREIAALLSDLGHADITVRAAVTSATNPQAEGRLEDILKAHARIHGAEGNFYRDVVASGCAAAGLEVCRAVERDLPGRVSELLHTDRAALDEWLKDMGAALGPPWSEDYRLATLAAWTRLAA